MTSASWSQRPTHVVPSPAISPDDQRFVMIRTVDDPVRKPRLVMAENWFEELKEKVGQ
jgi:hypothetical protein